MKALIAAAALMLSLSVHAQEAWCGHIGQLACNGSAYGPTPAPTYPPPPPVPSPPRWTGTNPGQLNPGTIPQNMCHTQVMCNQYGQCQQVRICN